VTLGSAPLRADGPSTASYRPVRLNGERWKFLSVDVDADMAEVKPFYADIQGRRPQQFEAG
jgi:hypothetical protein